MKTITLELTFKNDEDYFRFMDDLSCSEGDVRIPSNCKIKVKTSPKSERMTEERPIDMIVKQIETLIAGMPYEVNLDDDELRSEIYNNKSFLLEGLKRGISEERIFKVVR